MLWIPWISSFLSLPCFARDRGHPTIVVPTKTIQPMGELMTVSAFLKISAVSRHDQNLQYYAALSSSKSPIEEEVLVTNPLLLLLLLRMTKTISWLMFHCV
jgi:hypothetical protein